MNMSDLMMGLWWAALVVPAAGMLVAMAGVGVMLPGFVDDGDGDGESKTGVK
jgi:hypothetical protein